MLFPAMAARKGKRVTLDASTVLNPVMLVKRIQGIAFAAVLMLALATQRRVYKALSVPLSVIPGQTKYAYLSRLFAAQIALQPVVKFTKGQSYLLAASTTFLVSLSRSLRLFRLIAGVLTLVANISGRTKA